MKTGILFVFIALINTINAARILVVYPFVGGSHYILGNSVARVLVEAGHDVTLISPFEEKYPPKNGTWTNVVLTGFVEDAEMSLNNVNFFEISKSHVLLNIIGSNVFGNTFSRNILKHPNVQNLLKSNQKFDAVIIEQFNNDALKGFAHHFKAPLILVSSIGANGWVNSLVGNPAPYSYISEMFMCYSDHMTFFQRLKNTLFAIAMELNRNLYFFPRQNEILQECFPNPPHLNDLLYNVSLIFLNSHVSTNQPKPHVPAMVEIGGYHIKQPKSLPKDLQDFLDNAKEGVIYFSFGSNLKSTKMPQDRKDVFVKVLSKLKVKVLCKWEDDNFGENPSNVKFEKWLPQNDILAHPNLKLFITHGGLLSTTETIYHGKPILTIPIFADQGLNSVQAVNNGFALSLPFNDFTEEDLMNAINELLNNPKYYENAQKRSQIMHDRVQTPQQALVYWTEYVIRHNGASHLRVSALDLFWYQYLLLDVFAVCIISCLAIFVMFKMIIRKYIFEMQFKNDVKLKIN